mgnify:CR=1 FL=1
MHAVYKINPPKGERALRQKERENAVSFHPTHSTMRLSRCNRYSAVPCPEDCERVRAYEKGDYIPDEA